MVSPVKWRLAIPEEAVLGTTSPLALKTLWMSRRNIVFPISACPVTRTLCPVSMAPIIFCILLKKDWHVLKIWDKTIFYRERRGNHCLQTHTATIMWLRLYFSVGGHFSHDKDGYHTWHMVCKSGVIPYRQFYFPFHVALFTCTSMKMRSASPARLSFFQTWPEGIALTQCST